MDIRITHTKQRIIKAFFDLQEGTEKLTVRSLCEKAGINKSTFYKYYSSVDDLIEKIDAVFVDSVLTCIPDLSLLLRNPDHCVEIVRQMYASPILAYTRRLNETHLNRMLSKLHAAVREKIFAAYPALRSDILANIHICFLIYGGHHAFYQNRSFGEEVVCDVIGTFVKYLFHFASAMIPNQT